MHKLKHILNSILAIITFIMVVLIAILSWGVILFAIYDIIAPHTLNSILIYKLSAALWILLALPSHIFCQIIMYDEKIYDYVMSWIKNNSTKLPVILTLGYINSYFLDLYFIKNRYTHDFVTYNTSATETAEIILPIVNWIVYYKTIRYCRKYAGLQEDNRTLLKFFLKGQLMTHIIRNY